MSKEWVLHKPPHHNAQHLHSIQLGEEGPCAVAYTEVNSGCVLCLDCPHHMEHEEFIEIQKTCPWNAKLLPISSGHTKCEGLCKSNNWIIPGTTKPFGKLKFD